jgi:prevent-host-death family protein
VKTVALSDVKNDLSRYLRAAEQEEIVITRHGKPAGVLKGFASEDEWFEYRLLNDPRFLKRIQKARKEIRAGKGIPIERLKERAEQEAQAEQ